MTSGTVGGHGRLSRQRPGQRGDHRVKQRVSVSGKLRDCVSLKLRKSRLDRHVVSTQTFHTLDYVLWKALWRWAVRRHPKKSRRWVAERYFQTFSSRRWVFACTTSRHPHEEREWVKLAAASDTKIRRHVKVKADANPYDSEWTSYFVGRRSVVAGLHRSLKGLSRIRGNSYVRF